MRQKFKKKERKENIGGETEEKSFRDKIMTEGRFLNY